MGQIYTVRVVQHRTMDFSVEAKDLGEAVAKVEEQALAPETAWDDIEPVNEVTDAKKGARI